MIMLLIIDFLIIDIIFFVNFDFDLIFRVYSFYFVLSKYYQLMNFHFFKKLIKIYVYCLHVCRTFNVSQVWYKFSIRTFSICGFIRS